MLKKESELLNEKLCKVIEDIENLTRKEKASEGNIEKLKMLESTVMKQSEKIQNLEDKLKDTDLKVFEQTKEIDILKKKMLVLKENKSKVIDLE